MTWQPLAHRQLMVRALGAALLLALLLPFAPERSAEAQNTLPEFDEAAPTRSVREDAAAGADVGTKVSATDADEGTILTYSVSGDSNFSIVGSSGQIQVDTGAALDYEATSSHTVTVTANDGSGSASVEVVINVGNVDEAGTVTLPSAQPVVGTALTAALADPDGGITSTTWQWAKSESATGPFSDMTGANGSSYTPAAADVSNFLRASASYGDGEATGKAALAVAASVVRTVPAFASETATRSVAENLEAGANVGAPVAADTAGSFTYSITGANSGGFTIVSSSGQIQTGQTHNYEATRSYTLTVQATDGQGFTSSVSVSVIITDENDAPVFPSAAVTREISENSGPEAPVGAAVIATDEDQDALTYSISGSALFIIGETTGQMRVAPGAALDYETGPSYSATVTANDSEGGLATVTVNISVTDLNERPAFAVSSTSLRVDETVLPGAAVGSPVAASDPEGGLFYTISGAAEFVVDSDTGQIRVAPDAALDFETAQSYAVVVSVQDSGGLTASISVAVNVFDADDSTPVPKAEDVAPGRYAYLGTVHLMLGSNSANTADGYQRNGFGGLTAGDLPGDLFVDGTARAVREITVNRSSGQVRIAYLDDETGLFKGAEGLRWLRLQVRAVDNSIASEGNLWAASACADRTICLGTTSNLATYSGQAVAVDFFDTVQEALQANTGELRRIAFLAADVSGAAGFDGSTGHHIGGGMPPGWFEDGREKAPASLLIRHGQGGRTVELQYLDDFKVGLWEYEPEIFWDYRLTVRDRTGEELLRIDMRDALASMTALERQCGDATPQRRICLPYSGDFDGAEYLDQVLVAAVEDIGIIRLVGSVPGGPVAGQIMLALFAGFVFANGAKAKRVTSPAREWIILAAAAIGSAILPIIGIGSLFWAGGIILLCLLASGAVWFAQKDR